MSKKRRVHSAQFKAQVGLDALMSVEPFHAIAAKHGVHPDQGSQWKEKVSTQLPEVFSSKPDVGAPTAKEREAHGVGVQKRLAFSPARMAAAYGEDQKGCGTGIAPVTAE